MANVAATDNKGVSLAGAAPVAAQPAASSSAPVTSENIQPAGSAQDGAAAAAGLSAITATSTTATLGRRAAAMAVVPPNTAARGPISPRRIVIPSNDPPIATMDLRTVLNLIADESEAGRLLSLALSMDQTATKNIDQDTASTVVNTYQRAVDRLSNDVQGARHESDEWVHATYNHAIATARFANFLHEHSIWTLNGRTPTVGNLPHPAYYLAIASSEFAAVGCHELAAITATKHALILFDLYLAYPDQYYTILLTAKERVETARRELGGILGEYERNERATYVALQEALEDAQTTAGTKASIPPVKTTAEGIVIPDRILGESDIKARARMKTLGTELSLHMALIETLIALEAAKPLPRDKNPFLTLQQGMGTVDSHVLTIVTNARHVDQLAVIARAHLETILELVDPRVANDQLGERSNTNPLLHPLTGNEFSIPSIMPKDELGFRLETSFGILHYLIDMEGGILSERDNLARHLGLQADYYLRNDNVPFAKTDLEQAAGLDIDRLTRLRSYDRLISLENPREEGYKRHLDAATAIARDYLEEARAPLDRAARMGVLLRFLRPLKGLTPETFRQRAASLFSGHPTQRRSFEEEIGQLEAQRARLLFESVDAATGLGVATPNERDSKILTEAIAATRGVLESKAKRVDREALQRDLVKCVSILGSREGFEDAIKFIPYDNPPLYRILLHNWFDAALRRSLASQDARELNSVMERLTLLATHTHAPQMAIEVDPNSGTLPLTSTIAMYQGQVNDTRFLTEAQSRIFRAAAIGALLRDASIELSARPIVSSHELSYAVRSLEERLTDLQQVTSPDGRLVDLVADIHLRLALLVSVTPQGESLRTCDVARILVEPNQDRALARIADASGAAAFRSWLGTGGFRTSEGDPRRLRTLIEGQRLDMERRLAAMRAAKTGAAERARK